MASERIQRRIEGFLDTAEEAIARYDWEAVRQAALAVLAIDPDNRDGLIFLAAVELVPAGKILRCGPDSGAQTWRARRMD